jgi:hypothetical protein
VADAGQALSDGVETSALDPEDAKIVTLARSARGRTGATLGAAVRDTDGRTYAACTVDLPSLQLTALQAAVAAAVAAGAAGLEAVAVVGVDVSGDMAGRFTDPGLAAVAEVTASATVLVAGPAANVVHRVATA